MKQRFFPLGVLLASIALMLSMVACSSAAMVQPTAAPAKPATEPTKAAAPAAAQPTTAAAAAQPTAAPKAAGPTTTFKLSHHEPEGSLFHAALLKWADSVNQKTNGQVKIQIYPGETLAKGRDMVTAVQNGVVDIGWTIVGFFPGQFPLTEVAQLPVIGISSSKQGSGALWDLYSSNADIQKEWSSVKVVGITGSGAQWIGTAKKPVRVMDDVKGQKLRVAGWGGTELFKRVGASPMNVAPPEMYENISKGIQDGAVFDWQGINSNRLYEVLNYASTFPIIVQPQFMIMNQNKWKALSPEVQKAFDEASGKAYGQLVGVGSFDKADIDGEANFKKLGKEVITFSPEEQQKWRDAAKPVWTDWVKQVKDKNLDGQKALDQLLEAVAKNK